MQPLLYRLSGDTHPIHIDPAVSSAAGLRRPLLHGLATTGMAGYALLWQFCDLDASRLQSMAVVVAAGDHDPLQGRHVIDKRGKLAAG